METEEIPVSEAISITWMLIYTAIGLVVVHQLYSFSYFWRRGIRGPMPLPLVGNYLSFGKGLCLAFDNWNRDYGKFYGCYFGTLPTLMIADADIARQMTIKDFSNFNSREKTGAFKIPYMSESLVSSTGEQWKRSRSYMSPTFSGSKMKQMIPAINGNCDIMMESLDQKYKDGESFETKEVFGRYVLDNVASCAFGLDADCQRNPDDLFLKNSKAVFQGSLSRPGMIIRMMMPALAPLCDLLGLDIFPKDNLYFFVDIVKRAMESRKDADKNQRKDFLQLMINAAETGGENEETVKNGDEDDQQVTNKAVKKKIPITHTEIVGQSLLFFFAGYETVSTALSLVTYAVAAHPDVQKKVQEEIDEMIAEDEPVGYDEVFKMEYLDKVWCESQRVWPTAPMLKRASNADITYKGLTIPANLFCGIDVFSIHRSPEYWPDEPNKFNPENFSKEAKESRHPCAFLPFGAGPRNCVGMRFAILESKIVLIRMLQKYNIKIASKTPDLNILSNTGKSSIYPPKGIHIDLEARTKE